MSGFVWVTVRGPDVTAELAVPADLPVAEVLPDLVRGAGLLDAATAGVGHRVESDGGSTLDVEASLAGQGVLDGTVLWVRPRLCDPPPSPYDDVLPATRPRWFGWVTALRIKRRRSPAQTHDGPRGETTRAG